MKSAHSEMRKPVDLSEKMQRSGLEVSYSQNNLFGRSNWLINFCVSVIMKGDGSLFKRFCLKNASTVFLRQPGIGMKSLQQQVVLVYYLPPY